MTKTVLIVGASSGIGYGLAREFCLRGYKVYAGSRNVSKMDPLKELGCFTFSLDITSKESIDNAKELILKDNGGIIDILYLNAGITAKGTLFDIDMDLVESCFRTNVFGPLMVLQSFHKLLVDQESTVVFTSSIVLHTQAPFLYPYTASKTSFDLLARQLAVEAGKLGIKIVNIRTGAIESEIWAAPYVPPKGSIYYNDGESIGESISPNKTPADIYSKRVVSDIERAISKQRVYTCVYRGAKSWMAWFVGQLPFVSVYMPLILRVTKLTSLFDSINKRLRVGK